MQGTKKKKKKKNYKRRENIRRNSSEKARLMSSKLGHFITQIILRFLDYICCFNKDLAYNIDTKKNLKNA